MIQGFEDITEEQFNTLKNGISWITILIAGADGKIDENETEWAKKITEIRSYSLPGELVHFYEAVGKDFSERLEALIEELPDNRDERTRILSERIAGINAILPKLENDLAVDLYNSYKSFAKHVAKSSGGFLGMMSISSAEEALMDLPMLDKVEPVRED